MVVLLMGGAFYLGRIAVDVPPQTIRFYETNIADCVSATTGTIALGKPIVWAGLGDSYSAGVGGAVNGAPFGQDPTNSFAVQAAGLFRARETGLRIEMDLSACSGAVIGELFQRRADDGTWQPLRAGNGLSRTDDQLWYSLPDPLKPMRKADIITLTIGGNDAGFGNVASSLYDTTKNGCHRLGRCTLLADGGLANAADDKPNRRFKATTHDEEWSELRDRLMHAYEVVGELMKPSAHMYIVEYPIPFAIPHGRCRVATLVGARNMGYINRFGVKLGQVIRDAAAASRAALRARGITAQIDVIPWNGVELTSTTTKFIPGEPIAYNPHGLCGTDPVVLDIAPITPGRVLVDSFHPSSAGSLRAACATAKAVYDTYPDIQFRYELRATGCPTD